MIVTSNAQSWLVTLILIFKLVTTAASMINPAIFTNTWLLDCCYNHSALEPQIFYFHQLQNFGMPRLMWPELVYRYRMTFRYGGIASCKDSKFTWTWNLVGFSIKSGDWKYIWYTKLFCVNYVNCKKSRCSIEIYCSNPFCQKILINLVYHSEAFV